MVVVLAIILTFCGSVFGNDILSEFHVLKQEVKELQSSRQAYIDRIEKLENELQKVTFGKDMIQKRSIKRLKDQASTIAFSARLSHDLGYLRDDQILIFDHVITNQGSHYSNKTGIFHCDEAGFYVFQLSIVAVPGAYVTTQIARNHQGEAWAFSMDPTNSSSGGTMVVLYLQPGDAVYAKVNGQDHDNSHRSITKQYTSFSGFLIQ